MQVADRPDDGAAVTDQPFTENDDELVDRYLRSMADLARGVRLPSFSSEDEYQQCLAADS